MRLAIDILLGALTEANAVKQILQRPGTRRHIDQVPGQFIALDLCPQAEIILTST